jgi:flavorubredoxin
MGFIDWDRRIFDSLVPIPNGTSYNAYLIKGSEKTVLIDSVDPEHYEALESQLEYVDKLDYVVSLHAEQDHSGSIPFVLEKYPDAMLVTSKKEKPMLMDLLHIPEEKFIIVEDHETLSLGDKTLEFILTPWVHWPETMVAYLKEDKILFSCDFFGSHMASTELFVTNETEVYEAAKLYYAEIMMPYHPIIKKNLDKISEYDIDIIAPSHGQLYSNPEFIIELHKEWIVGPVKNKVVIPYVSMHSSTRKMVEHLAGALIDRGIQVELFNLEVADTGKIAISLVDAATVVLGTPSVLAGPHPAVVYAAYITNALRPKTKFLSIVGSYGWGCKTLDILKGLTHNLKAELVDPVFIKGAPKDEDFKLLDQLADEIMEKHKSIDIL